MAARTLQDNEEMREQLARWIDTSQEDLRSFHPDTANPEWWIGFREHFMANQALKLSMAIFELTTNAIKHGALSNEHGSVAITWSRGERDDSPMLELTWTEKEGPAVKPPVRKGFGSQILEKVITEDLNANVFLDYNPSGLCAN